MRNSLLVLLFAFFLVSMTSIGSVGQSYQAGIPPYSTVASGPDQINVADLSIHYHIPVFSRTGRNVPFSFAISYDNMAWSNIGAQWTPTLVSNGTEIGGVYFTQQVRQCNNPDGSVLTYNYYTYPAYQDIGGATHPLGNLTTNDVTDDSECIPSQLSASAYALDGSGIFVSVQTFGPGGLYPGAVITLPDGGVINPPMLTCNSSCGFQPGSSSPPFTWTDSNGNRITYNWNTTTFSLSSVVDSLGTTVLSYSNNAYTYTGPSGNPANVTKSFKKYTLQTGFGCSGIKEFGPLSWNLLDRVTLPDGTYYQFAYETSGSGTTTGRLTSVKLPTGGTIQYLYSGGSGGINCTDGLTPILTRVTPDGSWQYTRVLNQNHSSQVTIADPQGNQSVIQFNGNYEWQRQIYTGGATGTPIETVLTCYNGTTLSNCYKFGPPAAGIATYRSLNGGPYAGVLTKLNGTGLPSERDDFDFGASTPTRITTTTYANIGNGVVNRPSVVKVTDGAGTFVAETDYTYDQDISSLKSSSAAQLFPPSCPFGTCRGNVTSIKSYVTSTSYLTKTYTHYDTGQIYTATDVNSAITTFTYGVCGNSLLTNVLLPTGVSKSYGWNCTGGVPSSATDENGQVSNINYTNDPFWRPANVQDELGNINSFTYTGATQAESILPVVSGQSAGDELTVIDSLGRSYLSQTRQSPSSTSFDTRTVFRDSVGRPYKIPMPCTQSAGVACPNSPAATINYDGAGRTVQVTDGGQGTVTYSYFKNDVLVSVGPAPAGENQKQKQYEYDGLGRLTSVCEITNAAGSGPCGQTNPQTGFLTVYTYDLLGDVKTVKENTQGSPVQTRSFMYDSLTRMTSESNPESGTTTYFWDAAPSQCGGGPWATPGDLGAKKDNAGVYTCYGYDALHRLAGYENTKDSNCRGFVYDTATAPSGITIQNGLGRLINAYTNTACNGRNSLATDEWFSYNVRGEETDVWQSSPHSGGYYHTNVGYYPNGEIQSLSGIGTQGTYSYGVDGEGRPISASQGTTNFVTGVTYNNASQPLTVSLYNNDGDQDQYTYDSNTGRMLSYAFTVGSTPKTMTGTLTWNFNGTLSKLAITDGFNSGGTQTCKYGDPTASVAGYDDLGRLISVNCGSVWSQGFTYDPFGNITKSGTSRWMPGYNESTNQYALAGTSYDLDGNLLNDTFHTYTWNGYGNLSGVDSTTCGTNGTCLTYDAFGHMVEMNIAGAYSEVEYSPIGKAAVMNGGKQVQAYVPLPGGETLSPGPDTFWHADWLGSIRLASSASGRTITFDRAFAPFGEPYANVIGGTGNLNFTGDTQNIVNDPIKGLFDTANREQQPTQGRWISPDPGGLGAVSLTNPQSWNRYAYVGNNPLSATDPAGLSSIDFPARTNNPYYRTAIGLNGCIIDKADAPCGLISLDSGTFGLCPAGDCSKIRQNSASGEWEQYMPFGTYTKSQEPLVIVTGNGHWVKQKLLSFWEWTGVPESNREMAAAWHRGAFQRALAALLIGRSPFPARVPLRIIHTNPPLKGTKNYNYWNSKSTQEIIDSLKPGAKNPLTVKFDGGIMKGNTRILILQERGVDVNSLDREIWPTWPMDELGEPEIIPE